MVSILIPLYNDNVVPLVEALLNDAQDLRVPYELLIWDDGSTNAEKLPESIAVLPHVTLHRSHQNLGRTQTRQLLAQAAQYQYLLFLDADMLPIKPGFLSAYSALSQEPYDLLSGGIRYQDTPPEPAHYLRWFYGQHREAKPAAQRQQNPYFVISSNLWVKRDLFLALNKVLEHQYGLDNVFSFQLQKEQIAVLHLDNPVYHLGLEENKSYLQKTKSAVKTLLSHEQNGVISDDFTPLQSAAKTLNQWRMTLVFIWATNPLMDFIERQLCGPRPRLLYLDIYKLHHYLALKYRS